MDLNGPWRCIVDSYENGTEKGYYEEDADLDEWEELEVPFLAAATVSNDTLWLGKEFEFSTNLDQRARLVFKGAWLIADVWLNGEFLGDHEGYFSPFYFDITDYLSVGKNNLVVCLRSPVELELENKIRIQGVYNDWDCRPYPNWALGQLPDREWFTPIGLWRGVEIALSGDVTLDLALIDTEIEGENAHATVTLTINNRGTEANTARIQTEISARDVEDEPVEHRFDTTLSAGERRTITETVDIDDPRIWWPWDQGIPSLYDATIKVYVNDELQGLQKLSFGIRKVDLSIGAGVSEWRINDRRVFLRGGNYISDFNLLRSDKSRLLEDIGMFKDANLNFIRVHAHIEPHEFYEAADEQGILLMCDGPFIFAYANDVSAEEREHFETNAQHQIIEMAYLLYNNPSVILWSIHNEPPWVSPWMGDLYRLRLNQDIDLRLLELVRKLDLTRPALPSSGGMDEHLYLGWYDGEWQDYKTSRPGFPTEFGAQSLPNVESTFWSSLDATWPPSAQELSDLVYGDYQPSQWQNTGVGPPSAYPGVEAYVEASQEYQSVLLKTAIERFRILKYDNLGGMALFMLTDCHPAVTWSIIDYFRIPKAAYYAVKNAYNPTHVLIDWKGEYEIRDRYRVFYTSNSTAEFELLVVNDLPHAIENAELEWRMVDLTEGKTLLQEVIPKMTIPDGEAQPVMVANVTWDVPSFVDQDHSFVLETSLLASSGDLIDRNNVSFTVEASSQLVISAEGSDFVPNAEFAVIVDETHVYFIETNTSGLAKLTLPGGHRVVVVGPVLKDTSQIYVPLIVDLGTVEPATTVPISLKLVPGAIVRVLGNIPPVEGDAPVKLLLNIIPQTPLWDPSWITAYGSLSPFRPYLLNMTGDTAIAPAGYPFEMRVMSDDVEIFEPVVIDDGGKPFNLSRNEQVTSKRLAKLINSRNEEVVQDALEEAIEGVNEAESLGLYVALELGRLQQVESSLEKASDALLREKVFEAADRLKEAYNLCQNIISELDRLQSESATSIPLLMLLLLLTSLSVAALSTEKKGDQLITASLLLSAILVLLYYTYPGFKYANVNDYVTAGYIIILVIVAVSLGSEFLGNVKSVGGVSLLPAIAASTSLAIRNLKRRKLRTLLILLSVTIMVVGFTWLTTVSAVVSTREIKVTPLTPFKRTNFVIASKVNRPLDYDDITWISSQPETKALAIKAQNMPTSSPLGYVKTPSVGVYGIIGIAATDPNLETISSAVTPKNSLDKVLGLSKAVLVSGNLVEEAGVKIGDKVTVSGAKLEIAGFFDPDRIEAVRDVDDVAWLPDKMNLMGDLTPVRGDELIITNVYAAAELGSPLVRAYIQTLESQSRDLARKLSLLSSYFTKSYPRADVSYLYLASSVVLEVKGSLMIIPVALAILNMAAIMMAGIYARRKEISILSMVGLNPSHVSYVFLCEALVIGLTGGGVGYLGGVIAFKVLGVLGVYVPTDVKATSLDMITVVGLTVITTVLSYLVPSLRASTLVTPSLLRKWKLEGTPTATATWSTEIPAKIPSEKVANFVDHLCKRMREEEAGLEISVSDARWDKQVVKGSLAYRVFFRYSRGGGRPFTSDARMTLERSDSDYTVSLDCKTLSRYPRFADFYIHEVASYVRKLVLEWVSFGSRVMVPLGENMDQIIRLVKAYNPQLVSVVYRKATALKRPVREIEESLRHQGLLVPAVKLSTIQGNEIRKLAEELTALAREVDIICTDSDDGLLSIALAIAGMKEKKRLCYFADGRVVEEPPETFMQLMPTD